MLDILTSGTSSSTTLFLQAFAVLLLGICLYFYIFKRSMSSSLLSPIIAKALAQFVVVDAHDVQTSLFTKAGVSLSNCELQPTFIQLNETTTAVITGTVQLLSFSWNWGSQPNGGSNFVKDARLLLEKVQVTVTLSSNHDGKDASAMGAKPLGQADGAATDASEKDAPVGFVQDQVNRILDALAFDVSDLSVKIVIAGKDYNVAPDEQSSSLVLGLAGVTLESQKQGGDNGLIVQTMALNGLFANVLVHNSDVGTSSNFALLEPVSYATTVTRPSGLRDLTALLQHGLETVGASTDQGIVVHAGLEQVGLLHRLGNVLLVSEVASKDELKSMAAALVNDGSEGEEKVEVFEEHGLETITSTDSENAPTSSLASADQEGSFVKLPLSAISIILPNDTKISMTGLMLDYKLDGSSMTVTGREGVSINGYPIMAMSDSCVWEANLIESQFRAYSSNPQQTDEESVVKICARQKELDCLKDGAQQLIGIAHALATADSDAHLAVANTKTASSADEAASSTSAKAWSADIASMAFMLRDTNDDLTVELLVRDLKARSAGMTLSIGSVDKCYLPHTIRLGQPLLNTKLQYNGTLLTLDIDDVVAVLEEPDVSQKPVDDVEDIKLATMEQPASALSASDKAVDDGSMILPFGIHALAKSIKVYNTDGRSVHTTIKALRFAAGPDLSEDGQQPTGAIRTLVMMEEFNHDMLSMNLAKLSAVVHPGNLNRIDKLDFDARVIAIAKGYSVFAWRRFFATGDERREPKKAKTKSKKQNAPIYLPYAHVHEIKLKIAVKATLVSAKDATLHLGEFRGNESTTLNDMIMWYTQRVLSNAPGVITNASLLGFNVSDTAASYGGAVMLSSAVGALGSAAAPVAGVLGMVGFDAVKNTINAGKRERGAEDDDKRQLGDFFRGVGQLGKEAAQGGASARGKSQGQQADALDWALGATGNVGHYADQNKARLGGAGVGAVGFGYGFMLGGPVGALAGALIASRATSGTINVVDRRLRGKKGEMAVRQ
ncbi:hypothetical protein MPSEU_000928100 [Mayamaea pseudoterrestris]|nr:hypothetical protein MPSEU_000928100 [Mayamaea pseudoterrestris]